MRAVVRQEIRKAAAKHLDSLQLDFPAPRHEIEAEIYYCQMLILGKKKNLRIGRKKIIANKP